MKLNGETGRLPDQEENSRNLFHCMIWMQQLYVCKQFVGCEYDRVYDIAEGIKIRFTDVGHLLGSASIEVWATEKTENGDVTEKIVFSGDIGNINKPIIKDPKHAGMPTM